MRDYTFKANFAASADWEKEPNDDNGHATLLPVNTTGNGLVRSDDDEDWYKVEIPNRDMVQMRFSNAADADTQWGVILYDKDLKEVDPETFYGAQTTHAGSRLTLSAGTYYVKVFISGSKNKNYSLFVNWGKPRYVVSFNGNGGSGAASQTLVEGAKAKRPANPTRSGYLFLGWFTAESGGTKYDFNRSVNANVPLFAHWQEIPFSQFWDVTRDTPHGADINWLVGQKITTGYKDGSFRGGASVVRQDMAAFLKRLADYRKAKPKLGKAVSFRDVNAGTPHSAEIAWLAKTGVTTGWKDGTFRGMNAVVRQDMAAFLHRMKANVLK